MAEIEPLKGKYYSTVIKHGNITIEVYGGDDRPSNRELADAGLTLLQYESSKDVAHKNLFDCHYEKQDVYETALKIVEALNKEV